MQILYSKKEGYLSSDKLNKIYFRAVSNHLWSRKPNKPKYILRQQTWPN